MPIAHPRTPDPVDRITYPMQQLHIQQAANQAQIASSVSQSQDLSLPLLRYQPHSVNYQAMPLHRTRGRNVRFCGELSLLLFIFFEVLMIFLQVVTEA